MHHSIRRTFIFLLTLCMVSAGCSTTAETPLIPREVIFGNPEKAAPELSPDGTHLAYVAPDEYGVLNIWLRDLSHSQKEAQDRVITCSKKRGIGGCQWQYDNAHILYVQDTDGDENWHLYQVDIQSGAVRDLTPFDGVYANILEYNSDFPDEMLITLNLKNPTLFDVYRLNLKDGSLVLDTENSCSEVEWLADKALQVRASQAFLDDGSAVIRARVDASSPWQEMMVVGPQEDCPSLVSFSLDGKFLYMTTSLDANTSRLVKINVLTKEQEVVAEDPDYDISAVMVNPLTHEIDAVGFNRHRFEWHAFNQNVAADFKVLARHDAVCSVISQDEKGKKWIVRYMYDDKAPHYFLYERATREKEFLFTSRPELANYALNKMTPISYQARDGMTIYGYLTLPDEKSAAQKRGVLFVHGGPNCRDSWGFDSVAQWLSNRGYVVLQVNYRGSTGYGKKYLHAGDKEWGGKMQDDLLDAKAWLVEHGYVDSDKVAIYGGSYGGYATLAGLAFTPDEFCCGVDIVGPSNIITLLQSLPPYWTPAKASMDIRIGNLERDFALLQERSPLFKADQITKPLLIAHGANDPRVKQKESDQIVEVMRKNNRCVEYLLFEDEGHGFARPENRIKFFAAAEQFLSEHLGGRSQPPSEEEDWSLVKK